MPSWGWGHGLVTSQGGGLGVGSLGAQALDDPVPLHAVEEEEVVVRGIPLRQSLGKKTKGS